MFNRRNRTTHGTAYTGVNHAAPADSQPNSGALAAALTIGQSLKNNNSNHTNGISRSTSMQYIVKPQQPPLRNPSLLKRSPSVSSKQYASAEEHNNHAVKDLRLSHVAPTTPKMVKKYIPTANGIKIIEVPETNFAQEVSRSNSIRSVGRTSSLRTPSLRAPQKTKSTYRASSLTTPPFSPLSPRRDTFNDNSIKENSLEESLAVSDEVHEQELKLQAIQKQIDQEKELSKQIEQKRLEYEKIKQENQKKLSELAQPTAEEPTPAVPVAVVEPLVVTPVRQVRRSPLAQEVSDKFIDEQPLELNRDADNYTLDGDADITAHSIDGSQVVVDELDKKIVESFPTINQHKQITPEVESSDYDSDRILEGTKSLDPNVVSGTEIGIINQYGELQSEELLNDHVPIPNEEEEEGLAKHLRPTFEVVPEVIEEPKVVESGETLQIPPVINSGSSRSSLRSVSSFDSSQKKPVKSAMKNSASFYNSASSSVENSNAAHQAYLSLTTAENTRLNSKLSNTQLNDVRVDNGFVAPQVQAQAQTQAPVKRLSMRKAPPTSAGSMASRSLRPNSVVEPSKPELAKPNGFSGKTLRDRSSSYGRERSSSHGGRERSSSYGLPQPIAPHPALQPGYQSPSKLKAAELYAKANSRPKSVFKPMEKKSSFSKDDQPRTHRMSMRDPPQAAPVVHHETLRSPAPYRAQSPAPAPASAPHTLPAPTVSSGAERRGFKSRFNDSDDESEIFGSSPRNGGHYSSRLADSDDELPRSAPTSRVASTQVKTLRNTSGTTQSVREEPKTEKKKFGKLRKLFGSRN